MTFSLPARSTESVPSFDLVLFLLPNCLWPRYTWPGNRWNLGSSVNLAIGSCESRESWQSPLHIWCLHWIGPFTLTLGEFRDVVYVAHSSFVALRPSAESLVLHLAQSLHFALPESPRWLCKQGKWDEAREILTFLHNEPSDFEEIAQQLEDITA
ncbi:General substrate transporter [Penicillium italicum]|uniref:General substrate transporter n=1 Tax=Penicillium italicum TaxID=40296 RepID=A0A0A2KPZ1_PENIT|nr:General substrate transporter [Penicillium italicum]